MKNSVFRRSHSKPNRWRSSVLTGGVLLAGVGLSQGCLQREIVKQSPNTSNIFVGQLVNDTISEIDLLFVVDNSVSMSDKQEILKLAVPQMVQRLINPQCVNTATGETAPADANGGCPADFNREFQPVDDIHIGVISSSLGGHGSSQCARDATDPMTGEAYNMDDRGYLMPRVRPGVADPDGTGFLAWNGEGQDPVALVNNFAEHVGASGERGCGFEAPLEAWYRFLVDPQPPMEIVVDPVTSVAQVSGGVDLELLAQREAFLRPQGLVAIVVLTDENDCSAMDGGTYYANSSYGWLVADVTRPMKIATPICETNPNDVCCFSCLQAGQPPAGCDASACSVADDNLIPEQDRANARCFENRRRFGVDLLYPTERYVDALTQGEIVDARTSERVQNPLLRGAGVHAGKHRSQGLVFFAGIVGVPWQDIATDESLTDPNVMKYRDAAALAVSDDRWGGNRWQLILGQPNLPASSRLCPNGAGCGLAPVPPSDPFMIESINPRTTGETNPVSGDLIVASTSNDPGANNINGHEADHNVIDPRFTTQGGGPANDDLQYACIFPLASPKVDCAPDDSLCDCGDEPLRNRPLCQAPTGGQAGTTQYYGKAYPGTRVLQVLRDFGENSIVGSICPKITDEAVGLDNPNFGYNPAVQAIVDRLKEKLGGKCLPREVSTDENGEVPCNVIEALPGGPEFSRLICDPATGRSEVNQVVKEAVLDQLRLNQQCDGLSPHPCATYQLCEINELLDPVGRETCFYNTGDPGTFDQEGFCYIDPAKSVEDAEGNVTYPAGGNPPGGTPGKNPLVDGCPATARRLLRFVGEDTPAIGTITVVACSGDAASVDAPIPAPPTPVVPEAE